MPAAEKAPRLILDDFRPILRTERPYTYRKKTSLIAGRGMAEPSIGETG